MSDPKQPEQLWLLHNGTGFVPAIDCAGEPLLACETEDDAMTCAVYQGDEYQMKCVPVRVLPPPDALATLMADSRWKDNWTLEVSKFDGELICRVYKHSRGEMFEGVVCHPTPEAAVRAALETKGGV